MDKHDERPAQRDLAASRSHDVERSLNDVTQARGHSGLLELRDIATELSRRDSLRPLLQREADGYLRLAPEARAAQIDRHIAELGHMFVTDQHLHVDIHSTAVGRNASERLLGLQLIENRAAILERRESPTLIVPTIGMGIGLAFDRQREIILVDRDQVLQNSSSAYLVERLFHEQTDRMQHEAIRNPDAFPQFDKRLIESWSDKARGHEQAGRRPSLEDWIAHLTHPRERFAAARMNAMMKVLRGEVQS